MYMEPLIRIQTKIMLIKLTCVKLLDHSLELINLFKLVHRNLH